MMQKIKNAAIYAVIFLTCAFIGFLIFDRVAMPAMIGSGKAFPVPNLVGMTVEMAQREALANDFRFKIAGEEFSTIVPENRVLHQIPKAASPAKKNRTIRVVVSKGGLKTIVPDLKGVPLRQAQIELEKCGLIVADVEEQFSDSINQGTIIGTIPIPGETLSAGASVKIIVSKGSEMGIVLVPNLVGMQAVEACKTLHALGLKCAQVQRRIPTIANGEVFKQEPLPGTKVYRGNAVRIMVNYME